MRREVVLAMGCTEPVAVALAVAKARETLGFLPNQVKVLLSRNIFKNAMGVGIPGTGMIGLPIAIAMGLVAGKSERQLEVLDLKEEEVQASKQWLEEHQHDITIALKDTPEKLYVECLCQGQGHQALATIAQQHTHFVHIEKDGQVLLDRPLTPNHEQAKDGSPKLSARKVYQFATETPIEELEFILDTIPYNVAASDEGMKGHGLSTGKILLRNAGCDIVHNIVAKTVAAADARMDGCTKPVYSNSGSGNQGITCTLAVYEYALRKGIDKEKMTRALIMSHLYSIYIKQGIGRLSALCGIVNASIGVAASICYLQNGSFDQICYTIKNMINTLAGMACDGAKPSCALKITTGLYSAFVSSELALNDKVVENTDGLAENDIDRSIANIGRLGFEGMNETDEVILDIMTHKQS